MVGTTRLRQALAARWTPDWGLHLIFAGLALLAFVYRVSQGAELAAPQLVCDEFIYGDIARSVADEGRHLLRGEPSYQSLLYPVLLAPAWFLSSVEGAYEGAKAINAALMTLAAAPLYVWGRRLVSPGWALLAPALALLMPAQLYTGLLLSENAFLPAFLLGAWMIARAVEAPTVRGQLLALAAIGLACSVRVQGLVLLAVLPTALLLALVLQLRDEPRGDRARRLQARLTVWWPTGVLLAGGAVAFVAIQLLQGESISAGFGSYQDVVSGGYAYDDSWRFTKLHFAALALGVGLVPFSAMLVLLARPLSPARRAFVVTAAASVLWVTLEVGVFASRFGGSIAERYLFHVAPLLFLALAVWLADGLPRPWPATAIAAAVPAGLVLVQPMSTFLSSDMLISSFTLFGFLRLADDLGSVSEVVWIWRIGAIAAALAFAVLWRPLARVTIPAAIVVFLALAQWPAHANLVAQSERAAYAPGVGTRQSWIDDRIGNNGDAAFLYTPTSDGVLVSSTVMLELGFFNRAIDTVVNFGIAEACPLPSNAARTDPATGRISIDGAHEPRHVVAERDLSIAGTVLETEGPLALYRVSPPLSLATSTDGLYGDGWTGPRALIKQFRTPGGRAGRVVLGVGRSGFVEADVPATVTVEIRPGEGGTPTARVRFATNAREERLVRLPTPEPPFAIEVTVDPAFSPATYGLSDQRELGVQLTYRFEAS